MLVKKLLVFALAFTLGALASSLSRYQIESDAGVSEPPQAANHDCHPRAGEPLERRCFKHEGDGMASGSGTSAGDRPFELEKSEEPVRRNGHVTAPLRIIFKKKADYTDVARTNGTQGTVILRVTFLASGSIGAISVIKSLPDGLTENAIAAARKIRFEPEFLEGMPRATTRPVSYTFNIY